MRHIHPLEPIAVIVLICVLIYMRRKQGGGGAAKPAPGAAPRAAAEKVEKPPKPEEPPEVVYANLRRQALATTPQILGSAGDVAENEPYGALMEMGTSSSAVTLVCFADGDASLYYQTGGGMVGGIGHDSVRRASKEFLALAGKALPRMTPAESQPLPDPDRVRFYVLTPRGISAADLDRQELGESDDEFSALFRGGQEVVAKMREVQARRVAVG